MWESNFLWPSSLTHCVSLAWTLSSILCVADKTQWNCMTQFSTWTEQRRSRKNYKIAFMVNINCNCLILMRESFQLISRKKSCFLQVPWISYQLGSSVWKYAKLISNTMSTLSSGIRSPINTCRTSVVEQNLLEPYWYMVSLHTETGLREANAFSTYFHFLLGFFCMS